MASWEDRFPAGVEQSLSEGGFDEVCCITSERYSAKTGPHRERAQRACAHANVVWDSRVFDFEDQIAAYRHLTALGKDLAVENWAEVVFDLSTAPRSIIWTLLSALRRFRPNVLIRYYRALQYGSWQTDEEGEPKLIINGSGIMYPDLPTCIVMLCGPEISRAEKMFYRFEPRKALILRDPLAAEFGSLKSMPEDYGSVVEELTFDNKDVSDGNIKRLDDLLQPYFGQYNIVTASFGPKLGALILYKLGEKREEVALSYVTSGRHNFDSTSGIGGVFDVKLDLRPIE